MTFLQYFIRKKTALSNTIFHTFSFQPETAHSVLSKRKIRKLCPDRHHRQQRHHNHCQKLLHLLNTQIIRTNTN